MTKTRTSIPLIATAVALAIAGCGGDDDAETAAEATGATGLSDADAPVSYDITVEEFILATNKEEILDEYMANEPNNCSKVDGDFILTASAAATNFPDDAPLDDVIVDICGEP